jgi:hypothetical protein
LGYLIATTFTKIQEKKRLILIKNVEQRELKNDMRKYESRLRKWKIDGFDTVVLEDKLKVLDLTNKIQILRDYEYKIQKIKQFEKDIQQFEKKEFIKDFNYDIFSIKKKLKNPYKVDEIESDLSALKKRINLKIDDLIKKTDNKIKNNINISLKTKNPQQLRTLKTLQEKFLDYTKDIASIKAPYIDTINKIKEFYNQAETLNVPPEEEFETPSLDQIEKLNFYEIFNITPSATQDQIKKMFKRLTLAYHPDRKEITGVESDKKFRRIIEAYETLKDPYKRKKYDEENRIIK